MVGRAQVGVVDAVLGTEEPVGLGPHQGVIDARQPAVALDKFVRGQAPPRERPQFGDLHAVAHAIVALSRLALQNDPAIAEAEVNPLIVRTDGVVAVDALIRTSG